MTETVEVVVAVVGKAHGVRGEVTLGLRTDEPERRLAPGSSVVTEHDHRQLDIDALRWISGKPVVKFHQVTDRNGAEALRGSVLVSLVSPDERPESPDEFYDRQLVGLRVLDQAGDEVGEVSDVIHLPAQDLLSITTTAGEKLVPFVEALVPTIDLSAGLLQLAEVPGLLDDQAVEAE